MDTPNIPTITNTSAPQPPVNDQNKKHLMAKGFKNISGTLGLLIAAPLLALFITAHIFQPYQVDGMSMETTLQNSDRLIVYKLPKTISNLTGSGYMPKRWEVIVFDKPKSLNAPESTKHLIKRVIGLPGERIVVSEGRVTIYSQSSPDGFDPDNGREYSNSIVSTNGDVDITVGQNEVFVLGDNRGNSSDSRVFGAIPTNIIVGKATARFIPINAMKKL